MNKNKLKNTCGRHGTNRGAICVARQINDDRIIKIVIIMSKQVPNHSDENNNKDKILIELDSSLCHFKLMINL